MNESKWMRLSSEAIAPPFHPADAKWSTESASPYDVPSHVRSAYDPQTGLVLIEFRYGEHEPLEELLIDQYVTARVGKKTRRIWSFTFDAHGFNRDRKRIAEAARKSIASTANSRVSNADIAARAISFKGDSLLQAAFS